MINPPPYQSPVGDFEKDFAHDLPDDLLNAGWRKFWSKRENREYYYNKTTGASLWDLNELKAQTESNVAKRKYLDDSTVNSPRKRIAIDQYNRGAVIGPAFVPGSLYNFSSNSTASSHLLVQGRRPNISVFLPPHPIIELERANLLSRLRAQFSNSCSSREGINPPEGSFNRWMLQMKMIDCGFDPLFPSKCSKEVGVSMKRELLLSLPFPLVKPKHLNGAKAQLIRYAESVKDLVERRNASPPCRKIIKHNVDETMRWIRSEEYRSFDDYVEKLANLKRVCQPHIRELVQENVERICLKMYHLSQEYAGILRTNQVQLLQQVGINLPGQLIQNPGQEHIVQDPFQVPDLLGLQVDNPLWPRQAHQEDMKQIKPPHALGLACMCPLYSSPSTQPRANITMEEKSVVNDGESSTLTNNSTTIVSVEIPSLARRFQLTRSHLEKLEHLYVLNTKEDPEKIAFPTRLWCLLQRYYSYLGCDSDSLVGSINQAALPIPVFECLHRLFDVGFELFASPLNCYFPKYCSAFHDTDQYFGSCGPALEFFPISGSYEANPPFCEELLLGMVRHMENLLEKSTLPLSFIVFIPDWRDPPFEALTLLEASAFKRSQITLRAREHEYRIANFPPQQPQQQQQQQSPRKQTSNQDPETLKRSGHNTLVVFLQNEPGYQKWTPTQEKLRELVNVYSLVGITANIPTRRDYDQEYIQSVS